MPSALNAYRKPSIVKILMAGATECNKISLIVIACMTPQLKVVHLESFHTSAQPTAPTVSFKYLSISSLRRGLLLMMPFQLPAHRKPAFVERAGNCSSARLS